MNITVVNTLPDEAWRRFVAEHPDGNVFHTPEMFQVFARARGHQVSLWAAQDDQGQILALMVPVKVTVLGGPLARLASRSVVYGGILCVSSSAAQAALGQLLNAYNRSAVGHTLFTEVRHLADASDFQATMQDNHYVYEPHENFLIDLDLPLEALESNIHKSARKSLRRALNSDLLAIETIHDRTLLPTWHALLQHTYQNAQVPLADLSLFEAALDILHPAGMIQFLMGRVEDTYVAASVALLYKGTIYGWYRGFDRAYSSYLPNDLMVWQVLQWGATNGYHTFDFGGAGKPGGDYGPRKFKAKFGGRLVSFGRNTCVHSPRLLKLSEWGYRLSRRFL
ncbi:MAG: lipid II:glycine glycyltransferase FemX [Chloroflexota bacterium]